MPHIIRNLKIDITPYRSLQEPVNLLDPFGGDALITLIPVKFQLRREHNKFSHVFIKNLTLSLKEFFPINYHHEDFIGKEECARRIARNLYTNYRYMYGESLDGRERLTIGNDDIFPAIFFNFEHVSMNEKIILNNILNGSRKRQTVVYPADSVTGLAEFITSHINNICGELGSNIRYQYQK